MVLLITVIYYHKPHDRLSECKPGNKILFHLNDERQKQVIVHSNAPVSAHMSTECICALGTIQYK